MKSGLRGRWVLALRNAPDKKASVERALQKSVEAVNAALASLGEQLRPRSADKLQNVFNAALSLSRAKGMYEGLVRGYQLHKSYLDLQGSDAAARTLLRRIRKYPKRTKDKELTDKRLCLYLDNEIQRLADRKYGQPFPPASWRIDPRQIDPWQFALQNTSDKKLRQKVSTYLSRRRDVAWSEDYSLLVAWENLAKSLREMHKKSKREGTH